MASMEEELLQGMIRDREIQIKIIEKKIEDQKTKAVRLQEQKEDIIQTAKKEKVDHAIEIESLTKKLQQTVKQYRQVKDSLDMKKQQQQQPVIQSSNGRIWCIRITCI